MSSYKNRFNIEDNKHYFPCSSFFLPFLSTDIVIQILSLPRVSIYTRNFAVSLNHFKLNEYYFTFYVVRIFSSS